MSNLYLCFARRFLQTSNVKKNNNKNNEKKNWKMKIYQLKSVQRFIYNLKLNRKYSILLFFIVLIIVFGLEVKKILSIKL